jgi:hypothetical protein
LDKQIQNAASSTSDSATTTSGEGPASIKHLPTGLFLFGAFSFSANNDSSTKNAGIYTGTTDSLLSAFDPQIGIQRKVFLARPRQTRR